MDRLNVKNVATGLSPGKTLIHAPPIVVKPKMLDRATQVEPRWLLKAQGIETQGLINLIKQHLIDIICRITPSNREKMTALMFSEELCGDDCQPALLCYTLKGV